MTGSSAAKYSGKKLRSKRTELFYINTIGEADTLPITCSLFPVPCYIVALRSAIAYTLIKGGL